MTFDRLVNKILNESRPFRLPEGFDKLVDNIFYQMKRHYEDAALKLRERISPEEFYEKDGGELILIYNEKHDVKFYIKEFNLKQREIITRLYLASTEKAIDYGGDADIEDNFINVIVPLYDINFEYLRKIIIHEITHLYDPHLLYSQALFNVDRGLGKSSSFNYYAGPDNSSKYYTGTGYRAGKIPLEFNPKVVEIISSHSKSEIKEFLKTFNIQLLDYSFRNFVSEMFNHNYLKRKLLEKLYNYAYKDDEQLEIFHGAIYVYDSYNDGLVTQRIDPDITKLWNDTEWVADNEAIDMVAVHKEFTDHNEFKAAVKQYITHPDHYHNAAASYINSFDEIADVPGIYKLIAQEDHGILIFGKEIY